MARIIYSGLVTSIRGSIGGTTFQANSYGYTVKNKPNMRPPATPDQIMFQRLLNQAVNAWRQLTDSERNNWVAWAVAHPQYAKHNATSELSAYAVFTRAMVFKLLSGGSIITNPEMTIPSMPSCSFEIETTGGTEVVLIPNFDISSTEWAFFVFVSGSTQQAGKVYPNQIRYMNVLISTMSELDITTEYQSKFGTLLDNGNNYDLAFVRLHLKSGLMSARIHQPGITIS